MKSNYSSDPYNVLLLSMSEFRFNKERDEKHYVNWVQSFLYTFGLRKHDGMINEYNVLRPSMVRIDEELDQNVIDIIPDHNYYYQLEPVVMYLNAFLSLNGQKIDSIMAIPTTKTKNKKEFRVNGTNYNLSEEEFFKERIKTICGEETVIDYDSRYEDNKKDKDYSLFTIQTIIEKLRKINNDPQRRLNLWIDVHGGLRPLMMQILDVITLLKYEGIEPKDVFSVEFGNGIGTVRREKNNTYDMSSFVAGMNEFFSFGRSKTLGDFYSINAPTDPLYFKIKEISDAIQLCNMEDFDKAIKDMEVFINGYEQSSPPKYSDIFIETISSRYRKVMNNCKIIDKVEWCLENDFIQQALTVIESQMPGEWINNGVLVYGYDNKKEKKNIKYARSNNKQNGDILLEDAIDNSKPEWESRINYAIIPWIRENLCSSKQNPKTGRKEYIYEDLNKDEIEQYRMMEILPKCYKKTGQIGWTEKTNNQQTSYYIKIKFNMNSKIEKNEELKKALARMLMLHVALKDKRNEANHAKSVIPIGKLVIAIRAYIELTREVYSVL